jgi:cytosine/adenosine deaminase-related metal-dependent hydrolase
VDFVREARGPFAERLRARGITVSGHGQSPIAWLAGTGILETQPLLVHCVQVDAADISRIAESGATVAHCPISNAKFGHGVAPVEDFLSADVRVGLGSDSVASNNRTDILEEARFAALLQRSVRQDASLLGPQQLLRVATLDGARALGIDDRVGSLEPGKEADLIAVALGTPRTTPTTDPVATLFHSACGCDVVMTVVGGRVLYRNGEFATLDWRGLVEASEAMGGT